MSVHCGTECGLCSTPGCFLGGVIGVSGRVKDWLVEAVCQVPQAIGTAVSVYNVDASRRHLDVLGLGQYAFMKKGFDPYLQCFN